MIDIPWKSVFEIACFLLMLAIVFYSWLKKDGNHKQTIAYTIWIFVIFWINMPSFFVGTEGLEPKYMLFDLPFKFYNDFGLGYVIFCDIMLTFAGNRIGKSWEKIDCVDDKTIKKRFDEFSKDASELKIIGRDLDFLGNEEYADQAKHIKKMKEKAKLLCEKTTDPNLIQLYQNLIQDGNQIRCYTESEGIANLKAQIKIDVHRKEYGLLATKIDYSESKQRNNFEVNCYESGFALQTISREFDRIFDRSLNPVIKCIALDLGGVYFDGDLDDFYDFLSSKYGLKMAKNKRDRLNINDKLMLGEIDIEEFIKIGTKTKRKCDQLEDTDWDEIRRQWGETWKPNLQLKKLFEYIGKHGIHIVPFSNLDADNGNKYLREQYLPTCCTERFFSYEQNCYKPSKEAFKNFYYFVERKYNLAYPFQILLIDDQAENLSMAREENWYNIKYVHGSDEVQCLVDDLKKLGIIPGDFDISKL